MVASFLNRSGGFSKSSIDLVAHVLEGGAVRARCPRCNGRVH